MQNCHLFCLCLSFRLKVIKRYPFWKKKSGIFSFRVNDTLTSIFSALNQWKIPAILLFYKKVNSAGWKGTFFEKEVRYFQLSSEWYFDVNIVRSSSISHFTKRFKACKRFPYRFVAFKRSHERRKKVPFFQLEAMFSKAPKWYLFAVGSDVVKGAKKVPF